MGKEELAQTFKRYDYSKYGIDTRKLFSITPKYDSIFGNNFFLAIEACILKYVSKQELDENDHFMQKMYLAKTERQPNWQVFFGNPENQQLLREAVPAMEELMRMKSLEKQSYSIDSEHEYDEFIQKHNLSVRLENAWAAMNPHLEKLADAMHDAGVPLQELFI